MAKKALAFHGIDASNAISLLEYGLLVSNDPHEDGSGTHFCVYNVGDKKYDTGHISEKEINGFVTGKEFPKEKDINNFLSFVGHTKNEWVATRMANKLYDLLHYWGYLNIFGDSVAPMTEEEAKEKYL